MAAVDEEEGEVVDEEEGQEDGDKIKPDTSGRVDRQRAASVEQAGTRKRPTEVGYSLLDGQDATENDAAPDASSSCSSDLSFGGSSSGKGLVVTSSPLPRLHPLHCSISRFSIP